MNPDKTKKKATGQPSVPELTPEAIRQLEEELLLRQSRKTSLARTPPGEGASGLAAEEVGGSTTEKDTDKEADLASDSMKRKRKHESPREQRSKRSNRSDEEDDLLEDEVEVEDPLVNIMARLVKIQSKIELLAARSKAISRSAAKDITTETEAIRKYTHQAMEARAYLRGRVDEREEIKAIILGGQVTSKKLNVESDMEFELEGETFADVVRRRKKKVPVVTGTRGGPPRGTLNQVIISAEGRDAAEVERQLKDKVNPTRMGVQIRKMFRARKGLVVQCERMEDVEKLKGSDELKQVGLEVRSQDRRRPVIMIYDVEKRQEAEVVEEIYRKNLLMSGVSEEEFKQEFKVRHKYRQKEARGQGNQTRMERENWVVECSGRLRNLMRERGRVYVGWECCRVKDYIDVVRCFKCQKFGHVTKVCQGKETCGRCAGEHVDKECRAEGVDIRCVNCHKEGMEHSHETGWRRCPVYLRAVDRYIQTIEYES